MKKRQLGNSSLEIFPLAFGGNVFGWTVDEPTSFSLLDAFLGIGGNLVDTADYYSRWHSGHIGGESETIIGSWMKKRGNRDKVILATKVGSDMGLGKKCLSKNYIIESIEKSLKRLQTDYIDLYQSHFDDITTPVGETLEAYAELVKQGKVRVIGASNFSRERLLESLSFSAQNDLPRYESFQPEYNLYSRETFEQEYVPICREFNVGVISYFALASGFLTGKYRTDQDTSKSVRGGSMGKYMNERGMKIINALDEVSEKYKTSVTAVALTWVIARPTIIAPIVSATSIEQFGQIASAVNLELDAPSIELLNHASSY